jgi:hypothetical protein
MVWYEVSYGHERLKMQKTLKNWGFECDCAICQDEKHSKPPVCAQRRKLLEQIKQVDRLSGRYCGEIEGLLTALNVTYPRPVNEVPRLFVFHPQVLLARMYKAQGNMEKVLESIGKALSYAQLRSYTKRLCFIGVPNREIGSDIQSSG